MKHQNMFSTIKVCFVASMLLLLSSCFIQRGKIIDGNCRPKKANFKLFKTPFIETDKLKFNRLYTKNNELKFGIGFYSDGRLLSLTNYNYSTQKYDDLTIDSVNSKNWGNAEAIGYWRVNQNKIKIEIFYCGNSGFYHIMQGEIAGDTIIFHENIYSPIPPFKEVKSEEYVLSQITF